MTVDDARFLVRLDDLKLSLRSAETSGFFSIGIPIGTCAVANGCFDVLHLGHLRLLEKFHHAARCRGLRPIIALNSDDSIRRLKGAGRPIVPERCRGELLTSLLWPFTVVIFDEDTPQRLMDVLRPRLVVKGAEYDPTHVIRWSGSEVLTVEMSPGWSTSGILGER